MLCRPDAQSPGLKSADPLCYKGVILYSWDKKVQPAHSNQWSLFVQQEISPTSTFQIGYVGQSTPQLTNAELLTQLVWDSPGVVSPSPFFAQNRQVYGPAGVYFRHVRGGTSELQRLTDSVPGTPKPRHVVPAQLHLVALHDQLAGILRRRRPIVRLRVPGGRTPTIQRVKYGACYYNVKGVFTGYMHL